MNKQEKKVYEKYQMSTYYRLEHCYDNPSIRKRQVYDYLIDECTLNDGCNLRIMSYNNQVFTAGYIVLNGNDKFLVYYTPTKKQIIKVD